jgi:CHAT domain-containing protein
MVVVPDGAVALVPFDLLRAGSQLLIERAAISYVPTAASLLRDSRRSTWLPPWKLQLRGFADPVAGTDRRDRDSPALAATAQEVRAVADELGGRAALHVGADNRKAVLLDASSDAPVLHLATHAIADTSAMEQSRIMFSPPESSVAGADYLYLKEAYGLKLDAVDLVVLSACDTGRGRLVRAEGVQSFSRAFLAAGARSTVTTMWRVADRPTADFMQVFYHHLGRGEPRDDALRRAKLRLLNDPSPVRDPHYWAAFVLSGDGRHPVPRAVTWRALGAAAGGLAVLGAVATRFYRKKKSVPR